MDEGLTGIDLILCWLTRRILPLQYRERLLCQFNPDDRKDNLRTCEDNLPEDAILVRMHKLVSFTEKKKKKDKEEEVEAEAAKKLTFEERIVVSRPM